MTTTATDQQNAGNVKHERQARSVAIDFFEGYRHSGGGVGTHAPCPPARGKLGKFGQNHRGHLIR